MKAGFELAWGETWARGRVSEKIMLRYKAVNLIRLTPAPATNMAERSRRIDEAAPWQMKAADLEASPASDSLSAWLVLDLDDEGETPEV